MEQIQNDVMAYLANLSDIAEPKSNWASRLADPCLRRLVYNRTAWDKVEKVPPIVQGIFETGNLVEDIISVNLNRIGLMAMPKFQLAKLPEKVNDKFLKRHQIGAAIDRFLLLDEKIQGPVEIKSMNGNTYQAVHKVEDFQKYRWTRGYKAQLTIYMLGSDCEQGYFLLVNKNNLYDFKLIPMELDYEYAEKLVKAADLVNEFLERNALPERINDPDECPNCQFNSICCPEHTTGEGVEILDNTELEAALARLEELKEAGQEIKDLTKVRDNLLRKGQDAVCGKWMITWKKIVSEHKAREAKTTESWRKKIVCS